MKEMKFTVIVGKYLKFNVVMVLNAGVKNNCYYAVVER